MTEYLTLEHIDELTNIIVSKTETRPKVGLILGSGLSSLADQVTQADFIPFDELPGWPISTVEGHIGRLVIGEIHEQNVIVMQRRNHFYEGYDMPTIGLPIRVMKRLGVEIIIITNAAGAVNPDYSPGDLMLIIDHLNIIGMAGNNPLRGPNFAEFGPRFPDMSQVYDRELCSLARRVAVDNNMQLQEGVYVCLAGPSYETPADLRFLRSVGVDAVGMSTVPEAIVAHHSGIRVIGISGISNKANLDGDTVTTHEEVLEAGQVLVPKLTTLIRGILQNF
jgi:purine-nucleoside phosphorylase